MSDNTLLIVKLSNNNFNYFELAIKYLIKANLIYYLYMPVLATYRAHGCQYYYLMDNGKIFVTTSYLDDYGNYKVQIAIVTTLYADEQMTKKVLFDELKSYHRQNKGIWVDFEHIFDIT